MPSASFADLAICDAGDLAGSMGGTIPPAQAVDEYLDWQALNNARSPNTVRAFRQDLAIFTARQLLHGSTG